MAVDDAYTKVLLHMNGNDGSTTFTDESGKTWTYHNHAQIDTGQYKFNQSGQFDGTDDYISTPDSGDFNFGTGAFTVDFWVRITSFPADGVYIAFYSQWQADNQTTMFAVKMVGTTPWLRFNFGNGTIPVYAATAMSTNTWYHLALVRDGSNNFYIFQNGTQVTTGSNSGAVGGYGVELDVATYRQGTYCLNGWMDEFRISKGIARWTSNFTPPINEYGLNFVPQIIMM